MLQGMRIAATVVAFILALTTMNVLVASQVGVNIGAGGVERSDAVNVTDDVSNPQATSIGQQDPGFFGIATGLVRTFSQMWTLTTNIHNVLASYGVPLIIGGSIQIMVDLTMAIAGLQIWRGFKF